MATKNITAIQGNENNVKIDNRKKISISIGSIVLIAAVVVTAILWNNGENPELIGRWHGDFLSQYGILEFNRNGTGEVDGAPFTWTVEGNALIVEGGFGNDSTYFSISADGSSLVLHDWNERFIRSQ